MNITLADKMSKYEMRQRDDYHPVKPRIRGEIDQSGQSPAPLVAPSPVPLAVPLAVPLSEPAPVPVVASGGFGSGIINAGKGLFTSLRDNKMIALGIVIVIIIIAIFAYIVYRREPAEVARPPRAAAGQPGPGTGGGGQTNDPVAGGQTENQGAAPTGNANNAGGQTQSAVPDQPADTTRPELSVSSLYQRARAAAAAKTAEPPRPSKDEEMSKLMEDALVENDAPAKAQSAVPAKSQSDALAKSQSDALAKAQSDVPEAWGLADDTTEEHTVTEYVVTEPAADVVEETAPDGTTTQEVTPTPGCCDMWLGTRYCRNKASAGGKCHFHR